jgi:hypothetical protein
MRLRLALLTFAALTAAFALPAVASAGLGLLKPDPRVGATFIGKGGYSADGLGQAAPGGTLQADVPAGSKVVRAYLYGSYFIRGAVPPADLVLNFDGANVTLGVLQTIGGFLTSARAEVTAQVAAKVGTGGGQASFVVGTDPATLDGVALVVIYSNPGLPTTTIAVLDGAASPGGDTITFGFGQPVDPTSANFRATLSLGSGHGFQGPEGGHACGAGAPQSSLIDVNGKRLTSCAGNYDDGAGTNGALITVGGVGDAPDNPANPNQRPMDGGSPRVSDDELYNLRPFLAKGTSEISITTSNPSGDDLVFLAVIAVTGEAGVTPPPEAGKTFNAAAVSGVVSCRNRGAGAFRRVTRSTQLRVGSECDATKGRIRVVSATGLTRRTSSVDGTTAAVPTQSAVFYGGRFKVAQKRTAKPVTDLTLTGGDFTSKCGRKKRGLASAVAAADPPVRRLWGNGKGRFRTKGRYSSAAVRGTLWLTEDRCHSTVTIVKQGKVVVTDNVRHKQVTVRSGRSYVAKAPGRRRKAAGPARQTSRDRSWRRWTV